MQKMKRNFYEPEAGITIERLFRRLADSCTFGNPIQHPGELTYAHSMAEVYDNERLYMNLLNKFSWDYS